MSEEEYIEKWVINELSGYGLRRDVEVLFE